MRIKWYYFLKMSFRPNYEVFWQKIRNISTLEKLENMMKKECFFEKKRFHFFKRLLFKNGKAQNMPLLAGRLVYSLNKGVNKKMQLESVNYFLRRCN